MYAFTNQLAMTRLELKCSHKHNSLIVETFVISQFTYVIGAISMPEQYIQSLERLTWNFIWKSKSEKLKRTLLCKPTIKGGLNTPDVKNCDKVIKIEMDSKICKCE